MKKALRYGAVFFLSVVILTLLASGLTAKAQQGVTIGIYANCSLTYGTPDGSPWVQMDPSGAPPLARWDTFVNCSTISFRIINDSNPYSPLEPGYSFNETVKFRNGTAPVSIIGTIDLYYGQGYGASFFISPGLEAGDYIYPGGVVSGNFTWTINATRIDNDFWPGVPVCLLNYSVNTPYVNKSSPLIAQRTVIYWDQRTGVLLGAFEEAVGYNGQTGTFVGGALLYELIADNLGIPLSYPASTDWTPIVVAVAIGVVVVLLVVIVRVTVSKPKKKFKPTMER